MSTTVKIDVIGNEANIDIASADSAIHEQIQVVKTLGAAQQMILDRLMEEAFGMNFNFEIRRDDRKRKNDGN